MKVLRNSAIYMTSILSILTGCGAESNIPQKLGDIGGIPRETKQMYAIYRDANLVRYGVCDKDTAIPSRSCNLLGSKSMTYENYKDLLYLFTSRTKEMAELRNREIIEVEQLEEEVRKLEEINQRVEALELRLAALTEENTALNDRRELLLGVLRQTEIRLENEPNNQVIKDKKQSLLIELSNLNSQIDTNDRLIVQIRDVELPNEVTQYNKQKQIKDNQYNVCDQIWKQIINLSNSYDGIVLRILNNLDDNDRFIVFEGEIEFRLAKAPFFPEGEATNPGGPFKESNK